MSEKGDIQRHEETEMDRKSLERKKNALGKRKEGEKHD